MTDRIEKMRAKQKGIALTPLAGQQTHASDGSAQIASVSQVKKPKSPLVAPAKEPVPVLTFLCGHQRAVAKVISHRCEACQQQASHDLKLVQAERRRLKAEKRLAGSDREREEQTGRLPDGSTFAFIYDARAIMWTGELVIPVPSVEVGVLDGKLIFTVQSSAVCKLPIMLDHLYRQHLNGVSHERAEGDAAG